MHPSILSLLEQVEKQWLNRLYLHDREIFSGIHLPSHDHSHHFRVWQFARDLLIILAETGKQFSRQELELLILAVFFHDTGMSSTQHPRHGTLSREYCEAFLLLNPLSQQADTTELLDAIELHDDKDYTATNRNPAGLLTLLNMADDLDAFGLVGAYRYAEIYLMRGISCDEIPGKVLMNLDIRYNHLTGLLPLSNAAFARKCKDRFLLTRNFYAAVEGQQNNETNPPPAFSVHRKVLEEIAELVIKKKCNPLQLATYEQSSPETQNWWLSFVHEWNEYLSPEL
jgi:hypothetical protein